ncbi:MAG: hypothetical protein D3923_16770 [Candidatus Electrothrix sp. AR3]|nr:hypothetical protein [Candidatus Electrothrix sp. AR3]
MSATFFAGRTTDLEQLTALAEQSFAGKAQIAFVTGEAGMGKTSLAHELLRLLQEQHQDVVAVRGKCTVNNASYLPFRTLLEQLISNEKQVKDSSGKFKKVMSIKKRIGAKKIVSLNNLGWRFAEQGKWKKAESYLLEAISGASKQSQALYRCNIGRMYTFQEKYNQAEPNFLQRINILEQYEVPSLIVYICTAKNYAALGNEIESKRMVKISSELYQKRASPDTKAKYFYEYAETNRLLKEYETAQSACKKSLTWLLNNAEDPDDYQPVVEARLIMGKILVDMQSFQEAIPYLEKAKTAFTIGKHYALGETMLYLGKAYQGLDRRQQAENLLLAALSEFQRLGLSKKEQRTRKLLGLKCCNPA